MPLLDHFRPPLSKQRHWDSFLRAWAEAIARRLNQRLLPDHYYAETRVQLGWLDADQDSFEVHVLVEEGPSLVASVTFASPNIKGRLENRRMFAAQYIGYLQAEISVMLVDVVTCQSGNLHAEIFGGVNGSRSVPLQEPHELYATAYRTRRAPRSVDVWAEILRLGHSLPTLPLWIDAEQCVPIDLDET